jgi:hypothetical protein
MMTSPAIQMAHEFLKGAITGVGLACDELTAENVTSRRV